MKQNYHKHCYKTKKGVCLLEIPLEMKISADPFHKQVLDSPELCVQLSERPVFKNTNRCGLY